MIETMPNERPVVATWIENRLEIPRCCPVSSNPQPGSRLSIRYRAGDLVLEVFRLKQYVQSFVGGHEDGTRNMETMVQKIAQDCADALGVPVRVTAELELLPYQQMRLVCRANPCELHARNPSGSLARAANSAAVRVSPPPGGTQEPTEGNL